MLITPTSASHILTHLPGRVKKHVALIFVYSLCSRLYMGVFLVIYMFDIHGLNSTTTFDSMGRHIVVKRYLYTIVDLQKKLLLVSIES